MRRRVLTAIVAVVLALAVPAAAAPPKMRPHLSGAIVDHFDGPRDWVEAWPYQFTCAYGCWLPPYALFFSSYPNPDGSVHDDYARRYSVPADRHKTWRVAAWINADGASEGTGLQFRIEDIISLADWTDAPDQRYAALWTDVPRSSVGSGWQHVDLGTAYGSEYVPEISMVSIYLTNPGQTVGGFWLVGDIEFYPVDGD
jgi:hypothetical protein